MNDLRAKQSIKIGDSSLTGNPTPASFGKKTVNPTHGSALTGNPTNDFLKIGSEPATENPTRGITGNPTPASFGKITSNPTHGAVLTANPTPVQLLKVTKDEPSLEFSVRDDTVSPTEQPQSLRRISTAIPTPTPLEFTDNPTPSDFGLITDNPTPAEFRLITDNPTPSDFGLITENPTPTDFGLITENPTPTNFPRMTDSPTEDPTDSPTTVVRLITDNPTPVDFEKITENPTPADFEHISENPTPSRFEKLTENPTPTDFIAPLSRNPTPVDFVVSTISPSPRHPREPTVQTTSLPTPSPLETSRPSEAVTSAPSEAVTSAPSEAVTSVPTAAAYTAYPTQQTPTEFPTQVVPTEFPTQDGPTEFPTQQGPTEFPTQQGPTEFPTEGSPTDVPTQEPTEPTPLPSFAPTEIPTDTPTEIPTLSPTNEMTQFPTLVVLSVTQYFSGMPFSVYETQIDNFDYVIENTVAICLNNTISPSDVVIKSVEATDDDSLGQLAAAYNVDVAIAERRYRGRALAMGDAFSGLGIELDNAVSSGEFTKTMQAVAASAGISSMSDMSSSSLSVSGVPTPLPTDAPTTMNPSSDPTFSATSEPSSFSPSFEPTLYPTTTNPTLQPSTLAPSFIPTAIPTLFPSLPPIPPTFPPTHRPTSTVLTKDAEIMVALSVIILTVALAIVCFFCCQSGKASKKLAVAEEPDETTPSMYGAVDAAERGSGAGGNIAASGPAAAINQVLAKGVFLHTRKGPKKVKMSLIGMELIWYINVTKKYKTDIPDVKYIEEGKKTFNFARPSSAEVPDDRCFSLVCQSTTIDLECNDEHDRKILIENFHKLLEIVNAERMESIATSTVY